MVSEIILISSGGGIWGRTYVVFARIPIREIGLCNFYITPLLHLSVFLFLFSFFGFNVKTAYLLKRDSCKNDISTSPVVPTTSPTHKKCFPSFRFPETNLLKSIKFLFCYDMLWLLDFYKFILFICILVPVLSHKTE